MNVRNYAIASIAIFILLFVSDFIVHGILLKGIYTETAHLWRSEEEMQRFMPLMFFVQILFAAIFTFIFTRNFEGKGISEGVRYGLYIGVLIGILQAGSYCYMPIPLILAAIWGIYQVAFCCLAGAILSIIYKK